jgi:hypothetical protein
MEVAALLCRACHAAVHAGRPTGQPSRHAQLEGRILILFDCPFDNELEDDADTYQVYLMPEIPDLIVTAFVEAGTGLLLLYLPSVPLALLLGASPASPEALFVTRLAGAALLAIGVACWLARSDYGSPAQLGLLTGVLIYDVAADALLAYAGLALSLVGLALWPAVVPHTALAVWCGACLRVKPRGPRG